MEGLPFLDSSLFVNSLVCWQAGQRSARSLRSSIDAGASPAFDCFLFCSLCEVYILDVSILVRGCARTSVSWVRRI